MTAPTEPKPKRIAALAGLLRRPPVQWVLAVSLPAAFVGVAALHLPLPQDRLALAKALHAPQEAAEDAAAADTARAYLALHLPFDITLPNMGNLRIELALAGDGAVFTRGPVRDMIAEDPLFLFTPLGDALTLLAESNPDIGQFRANLPALLQDHMNDVLDARGLGRPIREVLILAFNLG